MGATHFKGPVYGGLFPVNINIGACSGGVSSSRYGFIPTGYRFFPRRVVLHFITGALSTDSVINVGHGDGDGDAWVDNTALTDGDVAATGTELTMNGTGDDYLDGPNYLVVSFTVDAAGTITAANCTIWGYLQSTTPPSILTETGED